MPRDTFVVQGGNKRDKAPARVITMAWGRSYVDTLLEINLPAVLASGNLPYLSQHFSCDLVIVTEIQEFERIASSAVVKKCLNYCGLRLVSIDDLISVHSGYGMVLTHALHRGFDDLGEEMLNYNLLFLNADFILADDSYRSLVPYMLAGERLIFAPSYCTESESALPYLRERIDSQCSTLSVTKREMAALILANRHATIRAKTINRPLFRMHVTDQFYWQVDENTLLGHQLPIAIVCMRPERVYEDPVCFWDYSTISMACPTASRCVLGDSDEFLMLELRSRSTLTEHITLGTHDPRRIATELGQYMTVDQFEMGRYSLRLHTTSLPSNIDEERANLRRFVDEVYAHLPKEPVSFIGHKFWLGQIQARQAEVEKLERDKIASDYRAQLQREDRRHPDPTKATSYAHIGVRLDQKGTDGKRVLRAIYRHIFGRVPAVTALHPFWSDLHHMLSACRTGFRHNSAQAIFIGPDDSYIKSLVYSSADRHASMKPLDVLRYGIPEGFENANVVLCDLNWMELNEFSRLYHALALQLNRGARIVAYHHSPIIRTLSQKDWAAIERLIPNKERVSVYFGGSPDGASPIEQYTQALNSDKDRCSRLRISYQARMMIKDVPKAIRRWRVLKKIDPHAIPVSCTSITVVADL